MGGGAKELRGVESLGTVGGVGGARGNSGWSKGKGLDSGKREAQKE